MRGSVFPFASVQRACSDNETRAGAWAGTIGIDSLEI